VFTQVLILPHKSSPWSGLGPKIWPHLPSPPVFFINFPLPPQNLFTPNSSTIFFAPPLEHASFPNPPTGPHRPHPPPWPASVLPQTIVSSQLPQHLLPTSPGTRATPNYPKLPSNTRFHHRYAASLQLTQQRLSLRPPKKQSPAATPLTLRQHTPPLQYLTTWSHIPDPIFRWNWFPCLAPIPLSNNFLRTRPFSRPGTHLVLTPIPPYPTFTSPFVLQRSSCKKDLRAHPSNPLKSPHAVNSGPVWGLTAQTILLALQA